MGFIRRQFGSLTGFRRDVFGGADESAVNPAPTTPADFLVDSVSTSSVFYTWTESTDDGSVASYRIRYATDENFTTGVGYQDFPAPAASGEVLGLSSGTQYWAKIAARDNLGKYSAYSAAITATTDGVANGVLFGGVQIQFGGVDVTFTA